MASKLAVEPDHALRDVLHQNMAYEGFAVQMAEYGAEALAHVQEHLPEAILPLLQFSWPHAPSSPSH